MFISVYVCPGCGRKVPFESAVAKCGCGKTLMVVDAAVPKVEVCK